MGLGHLYAVDNKKHEYVISDAVYGSEDVDHIIIKIDAFETDRGRRRARPSSTARRTAPATPVLRDLTGQLGRHGPAPGRAVLTVTRRA